MAPPKGLSKLSKSQRNKRLRQHRMELESAEFSSPANVCRREGSSGHGVEESQHEPCTSGTNCAQEFLCSPRECISSPGGCEEDFLCPPRECMSSPGGCAEGCAPSDIQDYLIENLEREPGSLIDDLKILFTEFNPCRRFVTFLMKILKKHVDDKLITDKRSLLKTPRYCRQSRMVEPGKYVHVGIQVALMNFSDKEFLKNLECVVINIGIDGCPIAKSGRTIWPILGVFPGKNFSPFLIGIYEGIGDPKDSQLFLQDLTQEINDLEANGIIINDCVRKPFKLNAILADTKARSFLTGVIGHTGFFGCGRCHKTAKKIGKRITYPITCGTLKTDLSFKNRRDDVSHKYPFPYGLENADVKMITQFPLCPMHLVYLGVLRTLGTLWFTSKSKSFKLRPSLRKKMNITHLSLSKYVPSEFSRKPDDFRFVKRWKATQCRQFLLYTGIVVLKDILDEEHYEHFLLLSVAIRILSSEVFVANQQAVNQAEEMLKIFVKKYPKLYGNDQIVFNVHNLLHLVDCVRQHGVLDDFSGFPIENFLQHLKKKIDPCAPIIPQVLNRIDEEKHLSLSHNNPEYLFAKGSHLKTNIFGCNFMFKTCKFNQYEFKEREADRYCILKDQTIVKIHGFGYFNDSPAVFGKPFTKKKEFYKTVVDSKTLGIFLASDLSPNIESWNLNKILCKLFCIPYKNAILVQPILHTTDLPIKKTFEEFIDYDT